MNQNGGSRTETLVKLVLIFVISLLSFSVGTFVGKQFSDSQHKMASLEKEYDTSGRSVASTDAKNGADEATLTDEDIANLTKEFIDEEKAKIDKQMEEPSPETVAEQKQPMQKPTTKEMSKEAMRVASGLAPTPDAKPTKRMPSSLPKMKAAESIGKYTVQVASYALEADAKSHVERLKVKGFSAFYIEAEIKGKPWYRVNVGLFSTRNAATEYRGSFMKQAGVSSALVQKIVK